MFIRRKFINIINILITLWVIVLKYIMLAKGVFMKIFKPKGFLAITYLIYAIFALLSGIVLIIIYIINYNKIYYLDICVFVLGEILILFAIYKFISFISTKIIFKEDVAIVKGQPIIYRKRIQHSCTIDLKNINKITDSCDTLNSLNKKYSPPILMIEWRDFIVIHMNNGDIYRIWTDCYSSKQINQIINLLKKYIN